MYVWSAVFGVCVSFEVFIVITIISIVIISYSLQL